MNNLEQLKYEQAVFVDETAFASFMDPTDPYYAKARSLFLDLDDLERPLITTNYVLVDAHQWLKNQCGYEHAQFFLDTLEKALAKNTLTIISGCPEYEQESRRLLTDCPDLRLSLSEALTAVVLITHRIKRIFTFNPSFIFLSKLDAGIKVMPSIV
ncbi:type II toxin-antitoxin system VapC family toxin [Paenibacillus xerothermodurans]|uniref:PIN domain-containing protein n=1 Tax=Paenibacillus xerothermodurans TaxID=1977292 RepID=A0A2W1NDR5_PAEXE|nr:hypothetical protein [Paenibacillus xerothermodurans]PZE21750.1 hypothetical protein CBW46_004870 [Paenibacillus xerothermodurans]